MLLRGGTATPTASVVRKQNMVQQHTNVIILLLNTAWLWEQDSSGIRAGRASPLDLRWHVQNEPIIQDISSYFWRRVGTVCSKTGPKIAF